MVTSTKPRRPALLGAWTLLVALVGCRETGAPTAIVDLRQPWISVTPSTVGMDSVLLARAADAAAAIARFRSLLVARHGRLALERYYGGADSTTSFDVRSVTKSVVSTLVGTALSRGRVPNLDAAVGGYFGPPDTLDAADAAVTVEELLTMTSGYSWNETTGNDYNIWIAAGNHVQFLWDRPQTGPPGPFVYNSAAVHVLGVLLQRAVGIPLPAFADTALFQPIGITRAAWEPLENGTVNGGSGLQLIARDLLRYGQLMLQQGRSGERQVVPAAWVATMTMSHFSWRETVGPQAGVTYGYLWWITDGPPVAAFFAWGYGGQYIYVVPARDLVVVATTDWHGLAEGVPAAALADSTLGIILSDVLPSAR